MSTREPDYTYYGICAGFAIFIAMVVLMVVWS